MRLVRVELNDENGIEVERPEEWGGEGGWELEGGWRQLREGRRMIEAFVAG